MGSAPTQDTRVVFRLRQIPIHADRQDAAELLSRGLGDLPSADISIFSIATTVDPWERPQTKTATVMFKRLPALIQNSPTAREWKVAMLGLRDKLILDSHFQGLTPLNDVLVDSHTVDCIAISGLASHAFGSWQQKGSDKAFMWLRDQLPRGLPQARIILYGYDSALVRSTSFQSIIDLSLGLITHLRTHWWSAATSKPIAFIAHSLGGLIVKQALVTLANTHDGMVDKVKGAMFFGVPNMGMEQSHLRAMVDGQPNETLVEDLAVQSPYLGKLQAQFAGISYLRHMRLYWAYETKQSPTVTKLADGTFSRTGPPEVLVTPESATSGLVRQEPHLTFPINENHSDIVKLGENDPLVPVVVSRLSDICATEYAVMRARPDDPVNAPALFELERERGSGKEPRRGTTLYQQMMPKADELSSSLRVEGLEARQQGIERRYQHTFEWIYSQPQIGFTDWLQRGKGLFWIRGKPASGKSTLMKFIFHDRRTAELLHSWRSGAVELRAGYFFHFRGSDIQKSFEGLLRSVLMQLLDQRPELENLIGHLFMHKFPSKDKQRPRLRREQWTLPVLEKALHAILEQEETRLDLCLFFDALDEYDGRPEFISRFLSDLIDVPETSLTRIRVVFSSRPWEVFKRHFGSCAGFIIHDYTAPDMRDYCAGSIDAENPATLPLLELVDEIVARSFGVFLWVKLVVGYLSTAATTGNKSLEELRSILKQLPRELDDYYVETVRRIPLTHRWDTYAALEICVRGGETSLPTLMGALACSSSSTWQEARNSLRQSLDPKKASFFEEATAFLGRCGGLLDVVKQTTTTFDDEETRTVSFFVQPMHQTVQEFVNSAKFKTLVLGDRAKVVVENGHSFLSKWTFVGPPAVRQRARDRYGFDESHPRRPFRHVSLSEKTTGQHQKRFIDSVPTSVLGQEGEKGSRLSFACSMGLVLYTQACVKLDPRLVENANEPLLTVCFRDQIQVSISYETPYLFDTEARSSVARLLLESGYPPDRDPDAFGLLVEQLAKCGVRPHLGTLTSMTPDPADTSVKAARVADESDAVKEARAQLGELVRIFLERGQDPDVDVSLPGGDTCKTVHVAPPAALQYLLDNGINPNTLDGRGATPLDYVMASIRHLLYRDTRTMVDQHRCAQLLVSRGGMLNIVPPWRAKETCGLWGKRGLDVDGIQRSLKSMYEPNFRPQFWIWDPAPPPPPSGHYLTRPPEFQRATSPAPSDASRYASIASESSSTRAKRKLKSWFRKSPAPAKGKASAPLAFDLPYPYGIAELQGDTFFRLTHRPR